MSICWRCCIPIAYPGHTTLPQREAVCKFFAYAVRCTVVFQDFREDFSILGPFQCPPDVSSSRAFAVAMASLHFPPCVFLPCLLSASTVWFSFFLSFFLSNFYISSHCIRHGSYPGSSPVLQLHLNHDDGRDIMLRKLRLSELPGDLSLLGLRECIREPGLLDLGVADLGVVDLRGVDLGGVDVGVVDFGGVPLGVVNFEGLPFGVVDLRVLDLGLLDRLPHREVGLLPQRERGLLDFRELGLLGWYESCGRAHASKLKPPICVSTARQKSASSLVASHSGSYCQSGKLGTCCR